MKFCLFNAQHLPVEFDSYMDMTDEEFESLATQRGKIYETAEAFQLAYNHDEINHYAYVLRIVDNSKQVAQVIEDPKPSEAAMQRLQITMLQANQQNINSGFFPSSWSAYGRSLFYNIERYTDDGAMEGAVFQIPYEEEEAVSIPLRVGIFKINANGTVERFDYMPAEFYELF
jgi:hypothetical protein